MRTKFLIIPSAILVALLCGGCNKDSVITEDEERGSFKVIEYTPAPGQFINENMDCRTPEEACRWAEGRLAEGKYVSLGAFGGYIIVDLGHSVSSFAIKGNSFYQQGSGSNEPGIVYVMTDRNGNGIPDDGKWIEIPGSASEQAIKNYSITYFRPTEPKSPVQWEDSEGNWGQVNYVEAFHKQDYYYPEWIESDSYRLTGTLLPSLSVEENGRWNHQPYDWGYADNTGSDTTDQWTVFSLSMKVDFIKVQTAVCAQAGALGEISTEVCGFKEL